jgi:hypothetical protein
VKDEELEQILEASKHYVANGHDYASRFR